MSIILYALGQKALIALQATISAGNTSLLDRVVVGEDINVLNDYSHEIRSLCKAHAIPWSAINGQFESSSEYLVAIGWRWLIKTEPNQKLVVFHDSLLPRYRGFNPLVTALINGDKQIGVTALLGAAEYDCGDIIAQQAIDVCYPIKIQDAILLVSECYASLFEGLLRRIKEGEVIRGTPQVESAATYSLWRDMDDYYINWNQPASVIKRMIDASGFPYAGAKAYAGDEPITIQDAEEVPDVVIENRTPGKVIFKRDGNLVVVCCPGLLRIRKAIGPDNQAKLFEKKFRIRFR